MSSIVQRPLEILAGRDAPGEIDISDYRSRGFEVRGMW